MVRVHQEPLRTRKGSRQHLFGDALAPLLSSAALRRRDARRERIPAIKTLMHLTFKIRRPQRTKETCSRKIRYGRVETAQRACADMATKKNVVGLEPYHCPVCGGWHIGHDPVISLAMELKRDGYDVDIEE